jgi:subtilase family serine protease
VGSSIVSQQSNVSLDAGVSKTVATQAYLKPGLNVLTLRLDAGNNVLESNKDNNSTQVKVTVDATCK